MASELSQEFNFRVEHAKVLLETCGKLQELSVAAGGLDDLINKHLRFLETEYNDCLAVLDSITEGHMELRDNLEELFEDEVLAMEFDLND